MSVIGELAVPVGRRFFCLLEWNLVCFPVGAVLRKTGVSMDRLPGNLQKIIERAVR